MENAEYWRKRFERLEQDAVDKGQEYLDTLDREYRTAAKRLEGETARWYQRLAKNNNITLSEARKWLDAGELAEFRWSVEEYIKYGKENAINGKWVKQLENASARVHISRLEALQVEMQQTVEVLYGNRIDDVDNLVRKIYSDGYYHTAFEVQRGFNVGWDLTPLNRQQIDRVISKPWTTDGNTFSDRIWKQQTELNVKLQTELSQSLLRGDSPDKAIKAISKEFGVSKRQAGRLVMTESAFFAAESQKKAYEDLGVERFEIVATLDSKTSELCQSLDGHIEDLKDYEAGVTAPPFHPWCRTCTCPYYEDNVGERAARDNEGKTYFVPGDMKYPDWKKSFVDGGSKDGLKPVGTSFAEVDVAPKAVNPDVGREIVDGVGKKDYNEIVVKQSNPSDNKERRSSVGEKRTMTLHDVEESKRGLDYEVGTLLSRDGVFLKEYGGASHAVSVPESDADLFVNAIFTHNHPGGRCFTLDDIKNFIEHNLYEVRASTPQGTFYSLRVGDGELNRSIANVMDEEKVGERLSAAAKLREHIMDNRMEMELEEFRDRVFDMMGEDVEQWLAANAPEFGYIFAKGES